MPQKVETTAATDTCLGYQFAPAITAAATLSAPAGTKWALLTCEGASMRYRCDGGTPTVSQGSLLLAGQSRVIGLSDWTKFRAIQTTATVTLTVEYWGNWGASP